MKQARRRAFLETLESRCVMAPFGAFPDDNSEYLLGNVVVTPVFMESDPSLPGADFNTEDWTPALIDEMKGKIQTAMNWWKDTLANASQFYSDPNPDPETRLPLLDFTFDWTWADDPVETYKEPINNVADNLALWVPEFLSMPNVDLADLGVVEGVTAFNNLQRERHHADWSFTIFVVNSTNDTDDKFPSNPSGTYPHTTSFARIGGPFLVLISGRPAITAAHESAHIFYALDEYGSNGSYLGSYQTGSGYYNTPNSNSLSGRPDLATFFPNREASLMLDPTDPKRDQAFAQNVTSTSSMQILGWRDSDGDGVMDVLDVPFTLNGKGSYDPATGNYRFKGNSSVRTLPNQNRLFGATSETVRNDITINKIRRVEYSLNGSDWTVLSDYSDAQPTANVDVTIPNVFPGANLKIRTFDQRTGASSEVFEAEIDANQDFTPPRLASRPGEISGFAFRDTNANGRWDLGEQALTDWGIELRNIDDQLLNLRQSLDPGDYSPSSVLNGVLPGVTITAVTYDQDGVQNGTLNVLARDSVRGVGRVFSPNTLETFATIPSATNFLKYQTKRELKIDFATSVSTISLDAVSAAIPGSESSVGMLEAYDANHNLIGRYTTGALGVGARETMTITRAEGDIKYVIAHGHMGTEVMFDHLEVGPSTATTTNPDGSFELANLPPGTYDLKVISAPNYTAVNPVGGRMSVSVAPGSTSSNNLYFAFQFGGNPWHNLLDPLNVNGQGGITAFDALLIINYLNLHPNIVPLQAGEAQANYYLDVNNSNTCTAFDALQVINYLNANPIGAGEGGGGAALETSGSEAVTYEYFGTGSGGNGSGGEAASGTRFVPQNAQEYLATNPLHTAYRAANQPEDHDHDDEALDLPFSGHDDHLATDSSDDFSIDHNVAGLDLGDELFADWQGNSLATSVSGLGSEKEESTLPIVDLLTADQLSLRAAVSTLLAKLRAGRLTPGQEEADGMEHPATDREHSDVLADWNLAQMKWSHIREQLMRRSS